MKKILLAATLAAACANFAAVAQQPAAAPTPDAPAMKCEKPGNPPGAAMMADQSIRRRYEREVKTYGDCVKAYVAERQTAAKTLQESAKAHADAGNAAVNEYNTLMKQLNDANK